MANRTRMKDIAARAGVSTVTVSKALAGMRGVSEKKRREIERIAAEMGYSPAEKRKAGTVECYRIDVLTDPVFFMPPLNRAGAGTMYDKMMDLLMEEACRAGCLMNCVMVDNRMIDEAILPDSIVRKESDGVIVLGEIDSGYRDMLIKRCASPIVFLDSNPPQGQDCVISDGFYGAYQLTNYLFDLGHRRIAYVGTLLTSTSITDRYFGYARSMLEHGVEIRDEWRIDDRDSSTGKILPDGFFRIPDDLPDAFLCNSDLTAAILFEKLKKEGIPCPEKVSIAGFDNFHYPDISEQRFTTYEVNQKRMVSDAVRIILKRINGDYFPKGSHIISGRIIAGNSVRPFGR